MRCDSTVKQIQSWFDTPGAAPMPDTVRDHIRDCSSCRAFIKQWNSIEVGLVSMREQSPLLSSSFNAALNTRLQTVKRGPAILYWFRGLIPPRQARLALAGSSAALLVWLCYLLGGAVMGSFSGRNGSPNIASRGGHPHQPGASTPVPADILLNNSR